MAEKGANKEAVYQNKEAILVLLQQRTGTRQLTWKQVVPHPGTAHFVATGYGARWHLNWDASGQTKLFATTDLGTVAICGPLVEKLWGEVVALRPLPSLEGLRDEEMITARILRDLKGI